MEELYEYRTKGTAKETAKALGVTPSSVAHAAVNGTKLKGLEVYRIYIGKKTKPATSDQSAITAVGSLSSSTRLKLASLIEKAEIETLGHTVPENRGRFDLR